MDEQQTTVLRNHRVGIVNDLEPRGKILDSLFEDGILTDNDIELVSSAKTRKERCQLLLAILPTRGPVAYGSFQRALQVGNYDFLLDQMNTGRKEIVANQSVNEDSMYGRSNVANSTTCKQCNIFLQKMQNKLTIRNNTISKVVSLQCCILLDNIEPKDIIDQLFQDHVLTADDIDRITARVTRRDRCEALFELLLATTGNSVAESLKLALNKKYSYIVKKISNDFNSLQLLRKTRENQPSSVFKRQTDAEKTREHSISDVQFLQKARVIKEPEEHSYGTIDNTRDTQEIQLLRKKDNICETFQKEAQLLQKAPREVEERYASTFNEPGDEGSDFTKERNINISNTATCKEETGCNKITRVKAVHDNNTNLKEADDGFDTVDGACVGISVSCAITEGHTMLNENNIYKDDMMVSEAIEEMAPASAQTRVTRRPSGKEEGITAEEMDALTLQRKKKGVTADAEQTTIITMTSDIQTANKEATDEHSTYKINVIQNTCCGELQVQEQVNEIHKELVPKQVTSIHGEQPSKRLTVAFNYLSTLINQGDFMKFESVSSKLQSRFPTNYDLMCIIGYLHASRELFLTNFDSAKSHIDATMAVVPKTSNPRYFLLELYTAKTRMYITRKKLEKLQRTLDEAMMILETDPLGCTGRAAGWLYINNARNKTAQLSCLNLSKPNSLQIYERLFVDARTSFQRSMTNFKRDGGKDGPFGFGYALCRLVILLLRCGDNGLTMSSIRPSADDIHTADQYLRHLEDSDIVISKIVDMHFRLAKCDFQFRRNNFVRAFEHAQLAHDLATEMRLLEFTEHAYNRVLFLKSKTSTYYTSDELSEEETQRILFEDSHGSDYDTG